MASNNKIAQSTSRQVVNETKVPVLYRQAQTGFFEPALCDYDGPVPVKVWKRLNKRFLKLQAGNYFFPLDPEDAYQDAVAIVSEKARLIREGRLVLVKASPETYLTSAANLAFLNFHLRKVQPVRATYRSVERRTVGKGAVGEDHFDIDNYDGTQDCPDKAMTDISEEPCLSSIPAGSALTAQQLVESLPGVVSASARRERAAAALAEICAVIGMAHPLIVRAFRLYVAFNGDMERTAETLDIHKATLCRKWPSWLRIARNAADGLVIRRR